MSEAARLSRMCAPIAQRMVEAALSTGRPEEVEALRTRMMSTLFVAETLINETAA